MIRARLIVLLFATAAACAHRAPRYSVPDGQWHASGRRGAVVAGGKGAVEAGLEILQAGGNAVDAAVATLLALSVTDGHNFAFGSEMSFMMYDARRGVVEVLSGQGAAPRLASRAFFAARPDGIPGKGLLAATVPAVVDTLTTALARSGTRTFAEVVAPTLRILDRAEKAWHAPLGRTLRRLVEAERTGGGDRLTGLRRVSDYFYRGPLAREIDAWSRAQGGLLRYVDLATHITRVEDPVRATYRGHTVYKCGVWTQGPYLLQTLQILAGFDLRAMGLGRADTIHVMVESLKLGLADRDVYYADPLFSRVPLGALLSPVYAERRRQLIDLRRASLEQRPGDPERGLPLRKQAEPTVAGPGGPARDTTTCLVADAQGNVVAATPSGWSGALVGDTGIWLGTRLQSFDLTEGHPNVLEPGKRPRITLTPTIVARKGRPVVAVSIAGGDGQDQVTLQMLTNVIDFGLTPAQAVTAPRFLTAHHLGSFRQKPPELGSLELDDRFGAELIEALRARGHLVKTKKAPLWDPAVLVIDRKTGIFHGAGDPAAGRHAGAY
jgi:gamma-glutamyltranspeptidase / glutathione hydrolase